MRLSRFQKREKVYSRDSKKLDTPFDYGSFTLRPTNDNLAEMSDGTLVNTESTIRIISAPYFYKQVWLATGGRRSPHYYAGDKQGFNGNDVLEHHYQGLRQELRDKGIKEKEEWQKIGDFRYKNHTAFRIIDYRWHHFVPSIDGNKTILEDCKGRNCPLCDHSDPAVSTRHFGGRKIWSMTEPIFNSLMVLDQKIQWYSASDNPELCGKKIVPGENFTDLHCSNCGEKFFSSEELHRATDAQIEEWSDTAIKCKSCGASDYPEAGIFINGERVRRASLQDVDITVSFTCNKTTRGRKPSVNGSKTSLSFLQHRIEPLIYHSEEFGSVPKRISDFGQAADSMGKKINLSWRFRPERLDPKDFEKNEHYVQAVWQSQAEALGVPVPKAFKDSLNNPDLSDNFMGEIPF